MQLKLIILYVHYIFKKLWIHISWMILKGFTLSEKCQSQNVTYCICMTVLKRYIIVTDENQWLPRGQGREET